MYVCDKDSSQYNKDRIAKNKNEKRNEIYIFKQQRMEIDPHQLGVPVCFFFLSMQQQKGLWMKGTTVAIC